MKLVLKLAALALAATLGTAQAKNAGGNGQGVPPAAPAALAALLDSYAATSPFAFDPFEEESDGPGLGALTELPPGLANRPDFLADPPGGGLGHTPAIPEPQTYAMMLAGLGALAFIGRRRLKRMN